MSSEIYNGKYASDDGMVDISGSASPASKSGNRHYSSKKKTRAKNAGLSPEKKRIIIISSVAAALAIGGGVTGFCLLSNHSEPQAVAAVVETTTQKPEFTFAQGAEVSGISVAGKTFKQAKSLLELNSKSFITPIKITVDADGDITELTQDDFDYTFDIDEVLQKLKNDTQSATNASSEQPKTYEITARATGDSVIRNTKAIQDSVDKDAKNARVTDFHPYSEDRFEYAEAESGRELDSKDLEQKIGEAVQSGLSTAEIEAVVNPVEPKIHIDDIKNNVVKLASYETYSTNTAAGTNNMKVALEACNGSIIDPDEVWSFNDCTGNSNLESMGYQSAHVIVDGKLTDGIGGGICQASTTIYNAAIRANMEIEERYCHKWASTYCPAGLDATIDYPNLDLKLSNPTDYQMFLECKVVDSTLYASVWGVKSGDYDEIKTSNELGSQSGDNYAVYAWRVYFKNGEEIDREELPSSSYDSKEYGILFTSAEVDPRSVDRNLDYANDDNDDDDGADSYQADNYAD
ncbi:MAG: VanW family protein, partial [Ruminococcus sp.]|nr:VanW family protein [Ruminococcus sp.]